jgi:lysine-N-methylase
MSVPLATLPLVEHWECHQCGVCCRGSIVPLREEDLARLRDQKWEEHPDFRGSRVIVRQDWEGFSYRLAQRDDGCCVFLGPEGRCRIHQELGEEAKPLICRSFPRQVIALPDTAILTVRRACPSAAQELGRPLAEHLPEARRLAEAAGTLTAPTDPPPLKPGEQRTWPTALKFLECLARLLRDERYPPVRRVAHGLVVCRQLERANTAQLSDPRCGELLEAWEKTAADEAAPGFARRREVSGTPSVVFRQMALEYVRVHPRFRIRDSWSNRWRMFRAGWRMIRGTGQTPHLSAEFPAVAFAALNEPLGVLAPEVYQPLHRYLETHAASYQYALVRRAGWSLVESFWSLALAYAVGLYLLRWRCAGRQPTAEDMADIVAMLDRGQGYVPLARARQRGRLRLLTRQQNLDRLLIWHAR